jgi:tricorn protease interacting factor F2/3
MKKTQILSNHISPTHYNLLLKPNLKKFIFHGKVEIFLSITKPTNKIILNSKELKIISAEIKHNNKIIKPIISLNKKQETLTLSIPKKINNKATIKIEFQGTHGDSLAGFYRSSYQHNNKTKYLLTTQFEAPYARKAFPCFDQPNKKATFSLSLEIPKNLKAISNMPISSQHSVPNKGGRADTSSSHNKTLQSQISSQTPSSPHNLIQFQKTPKMSTYLLYIGVGEFEFIKSKYKNIELRIATTPGKAKQGALALNLTKKFLKYFEQYSKIPYPLPKLDLIAIPDFNAGAMENWGAITFREILLLYDKNKTSTSVKKRIGEVIAHELWHQWSGNLVTMNWWNDLWLNESFATYMAFKAVDHYFPEWNMWEDFVGSETSGAFSSDTLKTTHPIAVTVNSPNEIEEIFDAISYGKGGSVLRMIDNYLGQKTFQRGVSNYLKKYKYSNAKASDLWTSLSAISNTPIKQIMESWINQPGHPIIETKIHNNKLILNQKRFNSKNNQTWQIPLLIKTNNTTIKTLLTKKSQSLQLPKNTNWFKLNEEQEGFYKVKYQNENLEKLKPLISKNQLSTLDRANIQNDLFSLSRINEIPISTYLDFIKSFNNEKSEYVLTDIYSNIFSMYLIFSQEKFWNKIWPKFNTHIKTPFEKNFETLGWQPKKNEPHNNKLLRPLAINYLSFSEDEKIIKQGQTKFQKHSPLAPDIKGTVYSLVARNGNKKTYDSLLNMYKRTENPEEKVKLLASLYKFKDQKILKSALDLSLSDQIRLQNLRTVFAIISGNPNIRPLFLPWVKSNWPKVKKYKDTSFVFMGLIESLITSYLGKEKEKEIRNFLNSKKVAFKKTQANAFETMQINTRFLEKNSTALVEYFSK